MGKLGNVGQSKGSCEKKRHELADRIQKVLSKTKEKVMMMIE